MRMHRYWMAHDCPNCGAKDEYDQWGGARMSSTSWGHDFSCCSDECGIAFAAIVREKEQTKKGRKWLAQLWEKLEGQSDARLCGEPYQGYNAECQLRALGRR